MAELPPEDARAFREDLGLAEPGLDRVIRSTYELLGLISFLTAGEDECRAWTIRRGTKAPLAAGTIHSDIERGFIRAEVVAFDDLLAAGSLAACRDKGTPAPRGPRVRGAGRRRHQVQVQRLRPPCRPAPPVGRPVAVARASCLYCGAPLPAAVADEARGAARAATPPAPARPPAADSRRPSAARRPRPREREASALARAHRHLGLRGRAARQPRRAPAAPGAAAGAGRAEAARLAAAGFAPGSFRSPRRASGRCVPAGELGRAGSCSHGGREPGASRGASCCWSCTGPIARERQASGEALQACGHPRRELVRPPAPRRRPASDRRSTRGSFEPGFAPTGSTQLELEPGSRCSRGGAARRRLPPADARPGAGRAASRGARSPSVPVARARARARRARARAGSGPPVLSTTVAQFRFYSGWRAAVERRPSRHPSVSDAPAVLASHSPCGGPARSPPPAARGGARPRLRARAAGGTDARPARRRRRCTCRCASRSGGRYARGELPTWNPTIFSGTPLLASYRPGALHPLMLALSRLPPLAAFQAARARIARRHGPARLPVRAPARGRAEGGLLAALGFSLGPYLVERLGDTPTLVAAPALPLAAARGRVAPRAGRAASARRARRRRRAARARGIARGRGRRRDPARARPPRARLPPGPRRRALPGGDGVSRTLRRCRGRSPASSSRRRSSSRP